MDHDECLHCGAMVNHDDESEEDEASGLWTCPECGGINFSDD